VARGSSKIERWSPIRPAPGDDDAVDALCQQGAHVLVLAREVVGSGAQKDGYPCSLERIFDALEKRNAEATVAVGRYQPHGKAALAQQTLCEVVGSEVQTLGRRLHEGACFLAQRPRPLRAFDTVPTLTPATRGTSQMVEGHLHSMG
jgi:hypothetical protein